MRNKKIKELWEKIKTETLSRRSPHQIALGIGIGAFVGIFPIEGFKTAVVLLIGTLYKKVNIVSLFVSSSLFSFIPAVPFVYFLDYWIGTKILDIPLLFTVSSFKSFHIKMLGSAVGALFLGGAVVGAGVGILSYFISLVVLKLKNRKSR